MPKWEIVSPWPRHHHPNALWFGAEMGLLAGRHQTIEQLLEPDMVKSNATMEAFILRSTGDHRSWARVFSGQGEVNKLVRVGDGPFYALGTRYLEDGKEEPFLLCGAIDGQSWQTLPRPPEGAVGLGFYRETEGYVWSQATVYRTKDWGFTFQDTEFPSGLEQGGPSPVVDDAGTLWGVLSDHLIHLTAEGDEAAAALPRGFEAGFLAPGRDGTLLLLGQAPSKGGREGQDLVLLCWHPDRAFEVLGRFPDLVPEHVHADGKTTWIVAGDVAKTPPYSLVLSSEDTEPPQKGERPWKREVPAVSRGMGPVYFEGGGVIWSAGSANRLQRRRP